MPVALDRGARGIADTLVALRVTASSFPPPGARPPARCSSSTPQQPHETARRRRPRPRSPRCGPAGVPWRARKHRRVSASAASTTSAPATARIAARARAPAQRAARPAPPRAGLVDRADRAPARPRARDRPRLPARPHRREGQGPQGRLRRHAASAAARRPPAPTASAARRATASAASRSHAPRWTRELVRGAHRFWRERFGFIASSVDWSGTHARRRGGDALERYQSARWPSQSVIRRLYGSPAAARADAFPDPPPTTPSPPHAPAATPPPDRRVASSEGHVRARDDASVHGRRRAHAPSSREATTTTGATAPAPSTGHEPNPPARRRTRHATTQRDA